jgi:CheY-like chemotaxis protein
LDRRVPVILLIEDDEADRMTLARMLKECGYNVMAASRGADALDTFVIHHLQLALVVSSSRLSDFGRAQLFDALNRIDGRVPIVVATRYASHGPNGEDPGRASAFAELIAQVQYRLQGTASAPASAASAPVSSLPSHRAFTWPLQDQDVDAIEWADVIEEEAINHNAINDEVRSGEELLERVGRSEGLKPIASRDPRNYLTSLSRARRTRRRRISRIGITVAAGSAVFVTALLEIRTPTARAIAPNAAVTGSLSRVAPLPSAPVSGRMGTVLLVPASRLNRSNLAEDLMATFPSGSRARATAPAERKRSREFRQVRRD